MTDSKFPMWRFFTAYPQFPTPVSCPWCGRSETPADKPAEVFMTCQCNCCENYYRIDFYTLEAVRAEPKIKKAKRGFGKKLDNTKALSAESTGAPWKASKASL